VRQTKQEIRKIDRGEESNKKLKWRRSEGER